MSISVQTPLTDRVFKAIHYAYHGFFEENGDPRLAHYPLMGSGPWSTLALVAMYLYFVKILGPNMMRDRKPFDLKNVMIAYNFIMVVASGWMFFEGCLLTNFGFDLWSCQVIDTSTSYKPMRMIQVGYLFFLSKFVEFLDTIFFVLRKKDSQITFLHVIHHSIVPVSVWIGLKFAPGGNNALFPYLNSAVHTLMYAYYGLAALGPQMRKYLWWKRHLTTIQMVQFSLVILHGARTFFMQDCQFPMSFLILTQFNAFLFLALFYSFYRKSYSSNNHPATGGSGVSVKKSTTSGSEQEGKSIKSESTIKSCSRIEPNNNDANRFDHNNKIKAH